MIAASRHIAVVSATLCVLLAGQLYFAFAQGRGAALAPLPDALDQPRARRLAAGTGDTEFFQRDAFVLPEGPGLFETDFFKPAALPPPKPPAPAEKPVSIAYRGLAEFADGARIVYLVVEGKPVQLAPGETVVGPWKLETADAETARFTREGAVHEILFNQGGQLPVPAK